MIEDADPNAEVPLLDIGQIESDIVTPEKLPRLVVAGPFSFLDNTPFSVFPNLVFDFAPCAINITKDLDELCEKYGTFSEYDSEARRVNEELSKGYVVKSNDLLKNNAHTMPETTFALILPLKSDGNKTGLDFLVSGQEKWKLFFRTLARARQRRAKSETETKHAAWFGVDYGSWPSSALEIQKVADYKMNFTDLEREALKRYTEDVEIYCEWIEANMLEMFDKMPSDFCMKMKPLKSPGTDRFLPDGTLFSKDDATFFPSKEFDMLGNGCYDPKNAWCKQSYYPLKKALLDEILPRVNLRFAGLAKGLRGDPKWEIQMKNLGAARESVIAWRINNPDKLLFVVSCDKSKPVWDVHTRELAPGDEFGDPLDDEWWSRLQGKPREIFLRTQKGSFTLMISPYQVWSIFKKKFDLWVKKGHTSVIKGKVVVRRVFSKAASWLRARIIMPARWTLNMFDGTVTKPYDLPLEHSRRGFPNPKPTSPYQTFVREFLSRGFSTVVPWATDVSHFETFWSSNPEFADAIFGNNPNRKEYYKDAASGFSATRLGAMFHGPQTSSGIGHTTKHSLNTGCFIASMDIGYRSVDTIKTAQTNWRILLSEGIAFAKERYHLAAPNPFQDYYGCVVEYEAKQFPGKLVSELSGEGSDDQGGWSCTNDLTRDEVIENATNPQCEDWRKRTHSDIEFDIGSHFAIIRTPQGVELDKTASDWKVALAEHKKIGDLYAAAIYLTLKKDRSGLADDFQEALDAIGGGDWHSYGKGYTNAMLICRKNPQYFRNIMDNYDPENSPSGARMSQMMEDAGFGKATSLKIDSSRSRSFLERYLTFIKEGH